MDFWNTVLYLQDHRSQEFLARFRKAIVKKMQILQDQPEIGFKSTKYSKFRRTLIVNEYVLIYSIVHNQIVVYKLKHKKRE
jgi:mRNA-degrading endonuclease RelE of RelBE toxin-antitoxin system